jgi:phosphoglycolate phosphatase-like HAD superfamily hydrolase
MVFLALDFDGVVSNSARECFVTGLRTYIELAPSSDLSEHPISCAQRPEQHDFSTDPLFAGLMDLLPLGNRAEDFGVAFSILDDDAPVATQEAYNEYAATLDQRWLETYHQRFYAQRNALRHNDLEGWLSLSQPYPEMVELIDRYGHVPMALATAKDATTVRLLLERYGIRRVFSNERILDKETGVTKTSHLHQIHVAHRVPFADITFVDDKVNHLEAVSKLGVQCALAGWGFNTDREHRKARELGFAVVPLNQAESLFTAAG